MERLSHVGPLTGNPGVEVPYIATGASVIFIVGYMDDMHPLPPLLRLIFHLLAAAWVIYPLPVPLWQRLLFVLWIAGATNAYNLIDGMDGLCLTITLITALCALIAGGRGVWLPFAGLVFGVLPELPQPRTFSETAAAPFWDTSVRRSLRGAYSRISSGPDLYT